CRPRARPTAVGRARRRGGHPVHGPRARSWHARGAPRPAGDRAHPDRVQPARALSAQPAPRPRALVHLQRGLGLRFRRDVELAQRLRWQPSPEDGGRRRAAPDLHGARRRLRPPRARAASSLANLSSALSHVLDTTARPARSLLRGSNGFAGRDGAVRPRKREVVMRRVVFVTALALAVFVRPAAGASPLDRSLDGSGNNPVHSDWGQAGTQYLRVAPPNYADGVAQMVAGPPTRYVSNRVFNDVGQNLFSENSVSQWGWVWGQFMDHDIGLRDEAPAEHAPIAFDATDPLEQFTNDFGVIDFFRTPAASGTA